MWSEVGQEVESFYMPLGMMNLQGWRGKNGECTRQVGGKEIQWKREKKQVSHDIQEEPPSSSRRQRCRTSPQAAAHTGNPHQSIGEAKAEPELACKRSQKEYHVEIWKWRRGIEKSPRNAMGFGRCKPPRWGNILWLNPMF